MKWNGVFGGTTGVILHSRDIRKCEKAFVTLFDLEVKQKFYNEINSILGEAGAYTVVTCSILKEEYIRQFGRFNDVYGQSLSLLVERAIFYLDDLNTEGDIDLQIIAEMRGKREDKNLLSYYNQLRDKGTILGNSWKAAISREEIWLYRQKRQCDRASDCRPYCISDYKAYSRTGDIGSIFQCFGKEHLLLWGKASGDESHT